MAKYTPEAIESWTRLWIEVGTRPRCIVPQERLSSGQYYSQGGIYRRQRPLPFVVNNSLSRALKRDAPIDIHPEVQHALHNHKPVVALETALVTNGMPAPTNLEVGRKLEENVRKEGAVPATIGIVNGRVKIGLEGADLVRLADKSRAAGEGPVKVSRRDIGPVLSLKKDGGTTICSHSYIWPHWPE